MAIRTEQLRFEVDGLDMHNDFCWDDTRPGARPGVLVFPEVFGISEHARDVARKLAGDGFAAMACDLHGNGAVLAMEQLGILGPLREDPARIRMRAQAALDALAARPQVDGARTAAIGYCFGGTIAIEFARGGAPIAAAVGLHCGLATKAPAENGAVRGKILACIGADDRSVPPEQRLAFEAEMREAAVDWRLHLYGGVVHSFTNPDAGDMGQSDFARYDEAADRRSWKEMLALFEEVFG